MRCLSLAVLVGACALSNLAAAETGLPQAQHYGSVDFIVGGIGQSESSAIEQASAHWPLALEFAMKDGSRSDFVTDVHVIVRDAKGDTVLKTDSAGPFLLAKLAPGHYTIDAALNGQSRTRTIDVKNAGSQRALMLWPAGSNG